MSFLSDHAALRELHARLADVEHGLRFLQIQHNALASQSASLLANIAAKRVPNAPMRALIPEICDIIFAYCAEPECSLDCFASPSLSEKSSPVILASVCRRWRALVLQNPSLWSTLHLRPDMDSPSEMNRTRLYLSRSADIPLRVTICLADIPHVDWNIRNISIAISPLVYILKPEFHRIQSLKTHLGMELLPLMFPPGLITSMPLLEELSLLMDDLRISVTTFGRLCAPKLRILRVYDVTPFLEVFDGILPTIQTLSVAETQSWKFSRFFPTMLARCVDLRFCSISFPNSLFFMDLNSIELPELQYLGLEWPFLFDPSPVFRALRAPNLREFRLSHLSRLLIVQPQTLSSLHGLLNSARRLRSLIISGCHIPTENDSALLFQESQSIEELELDNCLYEDRFLLPLTPTNPQESDKPWLCPFLTHVTIKGIRDWDVRSVINFAKSRSDGEKSTTLLNNGGKFLTDIVLDTSSEHLSRKARLLLFSGMLSIQNFLNVAGPFGERLEAKSGNDWVARL